MSNLTDAVLLVFGTIALIVVFAVLVVASCAIALFVCANVYALVKPHVVGLWDAWLEWFERRVA